VLIRCLTRRIWVRFAQYADVNAAPRSVIKDSGAPPGLSSTILFMNRCASAGASMSFPQGRYLTYLENRSTTTIIESYVLLSNPFEAGNPMTKSIERCFQGPEGMGKGCSSSYGLWWRGFLSFKEKLSLGYVHSMKGSHLNFLRFSFK
jgi:hypothetical protein